MSLIAKLTSALEHCANALHDEIERENSTGEARRAVEDYRKLIAEAKTVTGARWQHQMETRIIGAKYGEDLRDMLNRMGTHGWELCGVDSDGSIVAFFFKRPL